MWDDQTDWIEWQLQREAENREARAWADDECEPMTEEEIKEALEDLKDPCEPWFPISKKKKGSVRRKP